MARSVALLPSADEGAFDRLCEQLKPARCWEAARRIAPKHRLLKDVTAMEEMLASAHPEYF